MNGTSPPPSTLHDYLRANHRVELVTTSTDVFGVPLPEAVASGLLNRRQHPQPNLTASRPCVTENETTTKTMFVIKKPVLVSCTCSCPAAAPPAAPGGWPGGHLWAGSSRRAAPGGQFQAGSPRRLLAKPTRHVLPLKRVAMHTTEQNPLVMGTKTILANSCVSMTRNPVRLKSATLCDEAMHPDLRFNPVSKLT